MTVAFRASSSGVDSAASVTVSCVIPGASQVGDILIAWASTQAVPAWTCDTFAGSPVSPTYTSTRTNLSLAVWVHTVATGEPGATVTFTSGASAKRSVAGMLVLSAAGSVDVQAGSNGSSTSVDCPSVTPTVAHDAVVTIGAIQSTVSRTWSAWTGSVVGPSGGSGSGGSGGVEHACFYNLDQTVAAATGSLPLSPTGSTSGWASITLAVSTSAPVTRNGVLTLGTTPALQLTGVNTPLLSNLYYGTPGGVWKPLNAQGATLGGVWR